MKDAFKAERVTASEFLRGGASGAPQLRGTALSFRDVNGKRLNVLITQGSEQVILAYLQHRLDLPRSDHDTQKLFQSALDEIGALRRQNELLAAKVETMDLLGCLLNSSPARTGGGMAPDVAYALRIKIEELKGRAVR